MSQGTELIIRDLPSVGVYTIDGLLDSLFSRTSLLDLQALDPGSAALIDAVSRMRMFDQFNAWLVTLAVSYPGLLDCLENLAAVTEKQPWPEWIVLAKPTRER